MTKRTCDGVLALVLIFSTVFAGEDATKKPAAEPVAATEWKVLCDGKSLKGWKATKFGGEGGVTVEDGAIVMQLGGELTGINWDGGELPKKNYEISLETERLDGLDFFCGLVFPVGNDHCSFVMGGWGGGVVGLSAIDGQYADDNQTSTHTTFDDKKWYKVRLRVSEKYIQAWIDDKRVVNLDTTGKKISVHPAVDALKPLGVACYSTVAAVRNIRIRDLSKAESVEVPND
jgi:hypothetical protein